MLQKTLLNIEGLGRELDPNLDLWKTAKPYLENWMSEQIGFSGLVKNIKKEAPLWTAMLPRLPRLIDTFLTQSTVGQEDELKAEIDLLKQRVRWLTRGLIALTVTGLLSLLFILLQ